MRPLLALGTPAHCLPAAHTLCSLAVSWPQGPPPRGGFMLRSFRLSLVSLIIFVFLPFFATAQQTSFDVGTASAAPGQKATGYLEVPAGVDAGTNIPVVVVNGTKPGPVLALVTGAHGTEYVSVIAVERLIVDLDPAKISGTVIL